MKKGLFTQKDLDSIRINPSVEYHLLRHFSEFQAPCVQRLIGRKFDYYDYTKKRFLSATISKEDIKKAFETRGGKFDRAVKGLDNPKKIILFIKNYLKENIFKKKLFWVINGEEMSLVFKIKYSWKVGLRSFANFDKLSKDQKKRVREVQRSFCRGEQEIRIKILKDKKIKIKQTSMIEVEINKIKDKDYLWVTAYPSSGLSRGVPWEKMVCLKDK